MTDQDHVDLSKQLHDVAGVVVLSGYRCELYDRLYADWHRVDKQAYADGAKLRTESIWLSENNKTQLHFLGELTQQEGHPCVI